MTELAIEQQGPEDGPLVVLVHGSMDRMAGMAKLARRLSGNCSVIRYDRRGYGESAAHLGPFTMEHQVADLLAIVADRRCVLVGHSYGGNVVLAAADRRPELVAAVAVYETPLSWLPWWPGTTAGANAVATQGRPEDAAEAFMRRIIGDELWERLPERTKAARRAEGPALVGELTDLGTHAPWSASRIECAVIVGRGELGQAHHAASTQWIASEVRDGTKVTLTGCRHGAHASDPEQFAERLVRPAIELSRLAG
ncbi:MAG: alpha/beta fold hydrolase [Acidimicrobiia bacterium]